MQNPSQTLKPLAATLLALASLQATADTRTSTIEEIIVTAQKREESLQQTPIAISAFSTEALEQRGISQAQDVALFTPNMTAPIQPSSSGTATYAIRGIAQTEPVLSVDPSVGVYMNGVYMARNNGLAFDMADVERIEVLRGPQGTLYGRNSLSGAVNIVTAPPREQFALKQTFTVGSRDLFKSRTTIDTPEFAGFSAKIANVYTEQDGYVKNLTPPSLSRTGDDEDFGAKKDIGWSAAIRWRPSDSVIIDYNYDRTHNRDMPAVFQLTHVTPGFILGPNGNQAGGAYPFGPSSNNGGFGDTVLLGTYASFGNTPMAAACSLDPACVAFANISTPAFGGATPAQGLLGPMDAAYAAGAANVKSNGRARGVSAPYQGVEELRISGHSLIASWDISDDLQIKSITAYREMDDVQFSDLSGGGYYDLGAAGLTTLFATNGLWQKQDQVSQELQIIGSHDNLDWVAGLYYFRERADAETGQTVAPSYGAFNFSSYKMENEALAAFAQATYTPAFDDNLHITVGLRTTKDSRELFLLDATGATGEFSKDFRDMSGGLTLAYDISSDLNAYLKYSRGYSAGGFNARTSVANQAPFDPQYVDAYEVGFKSQLFDHRLTFNAAAFVNKFSDLQLSQFVPSSAGAETVVSNVGAATIQGIELEFAAVPTEGLTLSLAYGFLDLQYDEYLYASPANNFQIIDVSDDAHFPQASEHSISGSAQYDFVPFSWGSLSARVDVAYNSGYKQDTLDTEFDKYVQSGAFTLVNSRVTLSDISAGAGTLEFSAWGKNLTDEQYRVHGIGSFGAPLGFAGAVYNEPRSYGLDVTYRYE